VRNLEIKARCADLRAARAAALAIGARHEWTRRQTDTYFAGPNGRLKLRLERDPAPPRGGEGEPIAAELIFYRRADDPEARISEYEVLTLPPDAGQAAHRVLGESLGVIERVAKTRALLRLGASRIHLDEVDGLGDFVEIERVMSPGEPEADARGDLERIVAALGIAPGDLVSVSYSDLLRRGGAEAR
jgi:adenylate cyclase class IV